MSTRQIKPTISVIMPTLNSQRTLNECLKSIINQNYKKKVEIIITDGGSTDKTIKIAQKYRTIIYKNKLKTAEAGKALGAARAKGEILAFIDSDNILPQPDWFTKMTKPFAENKKIIASEPLYFTYNKKQSFLTRYFALLGMGDPINLFIGNYDRYCHITKKWTGLNIHTTSQNGYIVLKLKDNFPTIGANGFLIRTKSFKKSKNKNYFFDTDLISELASKNPILVAKVKVGIVHLFTGDIQSFVRKQRRRIKDYLYYSKKGTRNATLNLKSIYKEVAVFSLSMIFLLPLIYQSIVGFKNKKDTAWFFHPFACWITLFVYATETIKSLFVTKKHSRKNWKQ